MKRSHHSILLGILVVSSALFSCKGRNSASDTSAAAGAADPSAAAKFITSSNLSPQYIDMANKLSAAPDKETLEKLIQELKQNYDSYPADLQFLAAFYIPLEKLRSIVYRVDGVYKSSILGARNGTSHSLYVTLNRLSKNAINTYLPNNNWKAGYAYLTEPLAGQDATNAPFKNIREYQTYMAQTIVPSLVLMRDSISKISFSFAGGGPAVVPPAGYIVSDNKVIYGTIGEGDKAIEPFPNNLDRFILIGEAERKAVLAALDLTIGNILYSTAVNLDTILDLQDTLARELVNQQANLNFDAIEGLTTEVRAGILRDFASKYQLFNVEKPEVVKQSFDYIKSAVNLAYESWKEVKARSIDDATGTRDILQNFLALNPSRIVPYSRMTDAGFENIINVVNNNGASVRSEVTGEVVKVNYQEFYNNPPANLTDFLATKFDSAANLTQNGLTYRNFSHGTPLEWKYSTYAKYFPAIEKMAGTEDSVDIRPTIRTIAQSWGGMFVSLPLNLAIL